jgi:hypothetical protein
MPARRLARRYVVGMRGRREGPCLERRTLVWTCPDGQLEKQGGHGRSDSSGRHCVPGEGSERPNRGGAPDAVVGRRAVDGGDSLPGRDDDPPRAAHQAPRRMPGYSRTPAPFWSRSLGDEAERLGEGGEDELRISARNGRLRGRDTSGRTRRWPPAPRCHSVARSAPPWCVTRRESARWLLVVQ